jgi:hypothetical protein
MGGEKATGILCDDGDLEEEKGALIALRRRPTSLRQQTKKPPGEMASLLFPGGGKVANLLFEKMPLT